MNDQHQPNPNHFLILVVTALSLLFAHNYFFATPQKARPRTEISKKKNIILIDDQKEIASKESEISNRLTKKQPPIQFEESVSDSSFFDSLILNIDSSRKRDIVIRYYAKPLDSSKVYSLRKYGYYIHERPVENDYEKFASNAICYGDSVEMDEVLRVAYILMKQGFELQNISLSKYHDDWKNHAIEIGTDTTVLSVKAFSLAELRNKSFDY